MGTAQAQFQERRRYPRYTCDVGVEVRVAEAKTGYWGTLADICLGGCYVNTFSPLPAGTPVVLLIKANNAEFDVTGKTVTFHPGVGMGIEFNGFITPDGETRLRALIKELSDASVTH